MLKMNKLVGLAFTYTDDASSEAEWITTGRIGRGMIQKELKCESWVANRVLEMLGKKSESWFPHVSKMPHTLPDNAVEVFEKALKTMGVRFTKKDYGHGGVSIVKIK